MEWKPCKRGGFEMQDGDLRAWAGPVHHYLWGWHVQGKHDGWDVSLERGTVEDVAEAKAAGEQALQRARAKANGGVDASA